MRAIIAITLILSCISLLQFTNSQVITLGYSSSNQLPFLENATLRIQPGEDLWITASEEKVVKLKSPDGNESVVHLLKGKPILVKRFEESDPEGEWIIMDQRGREMKIILQKHMEKHFLAYDLYGSYLLVKTIDPESTLILEPVGDEPRYLLIAGTAQSIVTENFSRYGKPRVLSTGVPRPIRLKGNDSSKLLDIIEGNLTSGKSVEAKLYYPQKFEYSGWIGNTSYRIEVDPLIGRIPLKVENGFLVVEMPRLHEVGYGGILPLRVGEAVLEIISGNKSLRLPVYIVDQRFRGYSGNRVGILTKIPLRSAGGVHVAIICAKGSTVQLIRVRPPIVAVNLFDQQGRRIKNVTVKSIKGLATVINGTVYILAGRITELLTNSSQMIGLARIYVNRFKALDLEVRPYEKPYLNKTIILRKLTVNLLDQDSKPIEDAILSINSTIVSPLLGKASYELPPGTYRVEIRHGWVRISQDIKLNKDVELTVRLRRSLSLQEILIVLAILEIMLLVILMVACFIERKTLLKLLRKGALLHLKKLWQSS